LARGNQNSGSRTSGSRTTLHSHAKERSKWGVSGSQSSDPLPNWVWSSGSPDRRDSLLARGRELAFQGPACNLVPHTSWKKAEGSPNNKSSNHGCRTSICVGQLPPPVLYRVSIQTSMLSWQPSEPVIVYGHECYLIFGCHAQLPLSFSGNVRKCARAVV
jgi:hypothetical protein